MDETPLAQIKENNEKECLPYTVSNNGIYNNSSKVLAIDLIK